MIWRKMAHIFDPGNHASWAGSHAQVPTVLVKDEVLRVFYADRTPEGRSFTTFLDVDRRDPARVVYCHRKPVIGFGKPGTFDDEGIMPAFVIDEGDRILMYYSGWNRRCTVPYHNATGVAVSSDGGQRFERLFDGPILDRTPSEPYIAVTPCVIRQADRWRMWYVSGTGWANVGGRHEPVYVVKYAVSGDGIHWQRPDVQCVPSRHALEAFSHPCVLERHGLYRMWYCHRDSVDFRDGKGSYRMGYAESRDGIRFTRMDEVAGIDVSASGWDSKMICYPYVLDVDNRTLMFYNGNGFGQSGFGYAVLEE